MNKFEEFIDETDKELNVDTSTRKTTLHKVNSNDKESIDNNIALTSITPSPTSPIISKAKFHVQRLTTPIIAMDHPLKEIETSEVDQKTNIIKSSPSAVPSSKIPLRRNTLSKSGIMSKRRSLIQPVMASTTVDPFIIKNSTNEEPAGHAQGSGLIKNFNISVSNSVDPDYTQLSNRSRSSSLASSSGHLESNDINTLLKNLANKELELFESKQNIEDLKKKLLYQEKLYEQHARELQQLKTQVSKHLNESASNNVNNNNVNNTFSNNNNNSTKINHNHTNSADIISPSAWNDIVHRRRSVESNMSITENKGLTNRKKTTPRPQQNDVNNNILVNKSPSSSSETNTDNRDSGSLWSKPLALFNQFDQILQNELEKSLNWDSENDSPEKLKNQNTKNNNKVNGDISNNDNTFNPMDLNISSSMESNVSIEKPTNNEASVSTSIWNFVSGVKTGLLGIDETEEDIDTSSFDRLGGESTSSYTHNGMKEFKTTRRKSNRLEFIDGSYDNDADKVRKNVEMKDF